MVNIESNPLYYAAIGGVIIGIATSLNYIFRGSVTGMSGMLYGTVTLDKNEMPKNIAMIGGMLLIGGIFFDIFEYGTFNKFTPFGPESEITISTSQLGFALAGIFVGFGTKLSNGCTSGHGLCGLARFSIRSFVAVMTFLVSGFAIATIIYYAGGLGPFTQARYSPQIRYDHLVTANICIILGVVLPLIGLYLRIRANQATAQSNPINGEQSSKSSGNLQRINSNSYFAKDQMIIFLVGLIFGLGLMVAGMVRRSNIIQFLALGKDWNPSLMFVLGCGLTVNLIFFTYMIKVRKVPIFGQKLFNPDNSVIDMRLVGGALCFGLGWGIGGLCPGPAIMQTPIFTIDIHFIWFPFFFMGQFIANKLNEVFPPETTNLVKTKQTPNTMIKDSQAIVKGNPQLQIKHKGIDQQRRQQKIAQILHEREQGYYQAHKLPGLNTSSNTHHGNSWENQNAPNTSLYGMTQINDRSVDRSSLRSPLESKHVVVQHIH